MFDFELPSARERDHLKVSRTLSLFSSFFDFRPHRPGNEILQQFLRFYLFPSLIRLGFTLGPYWIPLDPTWVPLGSFLHPPWIHLRLGQPPRGEEGGPSFPRDAPPAPPHPRALRYPRVLDPPPVQGSLPRPRVLRYPEASIWRGHGEHFVTPSHHGTTQDPPLEPSGSSLDPSWIILGSLFDPSWIPLGSIFDPPGSFLDPSWILLGSIFDPSWIHLGSIWILLWSLLDPPWVRL